jgi:hypothetical protein
MTADENLGFFRNRSLPLKQRMPQAIAYLSSSSQVLKLYLAGFSHRAIGDSELVELFGLHLRLSVVMFALLDEFLPTFDMKDPNYTIRMAGMEKIKKGFATMVAEGIQILTEHDVYRSSELKRLIRYMADTFPVIVPNLPLGSRTETFIRLKSLASDPMMQDLNPELTELVAKVKSAVEDPIPL